MSARAFWAQRPLVCLAAGFGAGVWLGGRLPGALLPWAAGGLVAAALLLALLRWGRRALLPALLFLMLFGGMLWGYRAMRPGLPPEGKYRVEARVSGLPERRERDGRVAARLTDLRLSDESGRVYRLPGAYWTWYPKPEDPLPVDGQRLSMSSSLYHPDGQMNPYGFDFRLYLLQRGMAAGLSGGRDIVWSSPWLSVPQSPWLRARTAMAGVMDRLMGEDSALMKALLLAERSDLPEETTRAFRDSGIAHVLSVSGLHTGLLVIVLLALLRWLRLGPGGQMAVIALFLLMYCRMLDFAAPVVRAAILSLMLLGARLFHRRSDPLTSLALAFLLILAARPLDVYQAGFQLSFLAVLGIFTLGDRLDRAYDALARSRRLPDWLRPIAVALIATVSATLFTLPVTVTVFHQFPLLGLLWSPAACLLVALLMWGGIVLLPLALALPTLAATLVQPLILLSRLLTVVSRALSGLSLAAWRLPAPAVLLTLCMLTTLWLLTRYVRLRWFRRLLLIAGSFAIALLPLVLRGPEPLRYLQFSAGSADAALVEDGQHTLGIDAGENGSDLASYLLSRGRRIDTLYITHLHADHIGGLEQLMEAGVGVGELVLPYGALETQVADNSREILSAALERGIPLRFMGQGEDQAFGRASVRALWPAAGRVYPGMDANHSALTLLWQLGDVSLLAASDLTGDYERYAAHPAQVLKLAHHGSRYSSGEEFLRMVSPSVALLTASDSQRERVGDTLRRLEALGCATYATNEGGALILSVGEEGLTIEQYAGRAAN